MLAAVQARPGDALLVVAGRRRPGRAGGVDPGILRVVVDVEATVAVEVVAAGRGGVGPLRVGELALVEVDVVEPVLDAVRVVVDPALDVGHEHVGAAQVALRPGAHRVDAGGVLGVAGQRRPAGQSAVGPRLSAGAGRRQRPEEVPLLAVAPGAQVGGERLRLARSEPGVVGRGDVVGARRGRERERDHRQQRRDERSPAPRPAAKPPCRFQHPWLPADSPESEARRYIPRGGPQSTGNRTDEGSR